MSYRRFYVGDFNVAEAASFSVPDGFPEPLEGLPFANMASLPLSEPARFPDTDICFVADFGRVHRLTAWGLHGINVSLAAERRITHSRLADFSDITFAEPWTPIYERVFTTASLDFEAANWWTGQPLEEDLALYTRQWRYPYMAGAPSRYMKVEIRDPGNTEGAIDIGYLTAWRGLQPGFSIDLGSSLAFLDQDLVDRNAAGGATIEEREAPRVQSIRFSGLTQQEAMRFHDAGRRLGTSQPWLIVRDPREAVDWWRTDYLARATRRPRLTKAEPKFWQVDLDFEEFQA